MLNLSINHIPSVSDARIAGVIYDALQLIVRADRVCTYLNAVLVRDSSGDFKLLSVQDPAADGILAQSSKSSSYKLITSASLYNPSVHTPLGMTPEDVLLDVVQHALGTFNLDFLQTAVQEGWFTTDQHKQMVTPGTTNVYLKFYHGLTLLTKFFEWVSIQDDLDVHTPSEWVEVRDSLLSMGLGDTVYALKRICNADALSEALTSHSEISYDSCYRLLYAKHGVSPAKLVNFLLSLSNKYYCVVPIFEQDPVKWKEVCDAMDPVLRESFVELGQYIFSLDIRAFDLGELKFDEHYLGVLEERAERSETSLLATQFPGVWNKFQEKVPDKLVNWFLQIEPYLTVGLIDPIAKGAPINSEYIKLIRSQIASAPATGVPEYDTCEGELNFESDTNHFRQ